MASPRSILTTATSPVSTSTPATTTMCAPAVQNTSTRRTASCTRVSNGRLTATSAKRRTTTAPRHLGAVYFLAGGWERPHWYESNAPLVEKYGVEDRPHEWDARWWSPIINAEHLAMKDNVGMVDLAPFVVFDITGPGTMAYLQGSDRQQRRRRRRQVGLHADARCQWWIPQRPDDDAPRPERVPSHHRRLRWSSRRVLVPQAPARRWLGHVRGQDLGLRHDWSVGPQSP